MKLPCTLIILTHTAEPMPWLTQLHHAFERVVVWHDRSHAQVPPQLPSEVELKMKSFSGDFAAYRNQALATVQTPWCMFVDQDEWCTPELIAELQSLMTSDQYDAILFPRYDVFLGRRLTHGEVGHGRFVRAARTELGQGAWQRSVHETWDVPVTAARQGQAKHPLWHRSAATYTEFLTKLHRYAQQEPKNRPTVTRSQAIAQFLIYPIGKFLHNYLWRQGWRDGWPGLVHALSMSYYSAITRVFLYEAVR